MHRKYEGRLFPSARQLSDDEIEMVEPKKVKLVVFDMDDTLTRTGRYRIQAILQALAISHEEFKIPVEKLMPLSETLNKLGLSLAGKDIIDYFSSQDDEVVKVLAPYLGAIKVDEQGKLLTHKDEKGRKVYEDERIQALITKANEYLNFWEGIDPNTGLINKPAALMPGLWELWAKLKRESYRYAVWSYSETHVVKAKLCSAAYLDAKQALLEGVCLSGRNDVKKEEVKPGTQHFLYVLESLGFSLEEIESVIFVDDTERALQILANLAKDAPELAKKAGFILVNTREGVDLAAREAKFIKLCADKDINFANVAFTEINEAKPLGCLMETIKNLQVNLEQALAEPMEGLSLAL